MWTPDTYDAASADLVIYVHGYYVTADEAWREHRLAEQFARSGVNAMFVVCGAPSTWNEPVDWPSLDELITAIPKAPGGRVIAIAHSGGHRTIRSWVGPRLEGLILLDAAYGPFPEVIDWLGEPTHRLLDASNLTRAWAETLHASLPESAIGDDFDGDHTGDRVVHVRTQIGHMELVTEGVALPALVRWALPARSDAATERPQQMVDAGTVDRAPDREIEDRESRLQR